MGETPSRYEFRVFAQDFGVVEEEIRRRAEVTRYRESREVYLMSAGNNENNTKVRGGLMDIKTRLQSDRGLEQWEPRMKAAFPLAQHVIRNEVFAAFGVAAPELKREAYSLKHYLDEVIEPHAQLAAVSVYKQRYGFDIHGCMAELATVYINGAVIRTVCLEAGDPDLVLATRVRLHLDCYENVNYMLAIKRVVGMAPLPKDAFYRAC